MTLLAASPLFRGLPVHLLMSGMARQDSRKQLDWARSTLESAGFDAPAALVRGDAETIIARSIREQAIDLLRSAAIPTLLLR